MRPPALLLAATLALVGTAASAAPLTVTPLTVTFAPAPGNPAAPQMGDQLSFHSVIRNDGAAPVDGLIGWISLVRIDPGEEQPVDLEDWSAQKAVTAVRLAPGEAIDTNWPMRLIQAGHYRVLVSVITREASALTASPFADFTVREKPVVESLRVLPVAFGVPLVFAGLLVWREVRRRFPRGQAATANK